jgi:hypothetical protein
MPRARAALVRQAPRAHPIRFATHFLTVNDQEKSKDFFVQILGHQNSFAAFGSECLIFQFGTTKFTPSSTKVFARLFPPPRQDIQMER